MRNTQVRLVKEFNNVLSSIARNTSCNSGWLRHFVQMLFGTVIACSFILIMLMVVGKSKDTTSLSRCSVTNCRVICNDAPLYEEYEDDIINAASEAEASCESIILVLNQPLFKNFQIPENWLSRMRSNVRELSIIGGNIKNIAPHAFISPFSNNIRVLTLEEIEITIWENDMFVGLSNLKKLFLSDCMFHDIRKGALTAVDDSLELLDIKASNLWDPVNVTGSTRLLELNIVDFSYNTFRHNLRNESFSKLKACKVLFLNSCQISSLQPGTFDYLENLEILYLNDNFLTSIPVGLFDKILPRKPRIALQENYWHCDCNSEDLRNVIRKDLVIVDPVCHYPDTKAGMTFSDFEGYCNTKEENNSNVMDDNRSYLNGHNISKVIYINGACHGNSSSRSNNFNPSLRIIAPSEHQNCLLNRITKEDIMLFASQSDKELLSVSSNWIKPIFFVQNNPYSMVEIKSLEWPGFGLLWYQSSCPDAVYCVNTVPNLLKVFNVDVRNNFTFCPFNLTSGNVKSSQCASYDLTDIDISRTFISNDNEIVLLICLSLGCLMCGAVFVYGLIQRNPSLLKGNNRVLLVKHRTVEALILPPKIPLKKVLNDSDPKFSNGKNKIFILPPKLDTLTCQNFNRSVSIRSNESNDASYISALQPTEEQLAEWRSNQIANKPTSEFSMMPYTSIHERESYYSLCSDETIYEVPK